MHTHIQTRTKNSTKKYNTTHHHSLWLAISHPSPECFVGVMMVAGKRGEEVLTWSKAAPFGDHDGPPPILPGSLVV